MRWEGLFADMEAQLDAVAAQEQLDTVAELTRAERGKVLLADRVRAARGAVLSLRLRSGGEVGGVVVDAAASWVLLRDDTVAREHLVPTAAVAMLTGLPYEAAPSPGAALRRLGLAHALRAVARDRAVVRVVTGSVTATGRIDAVGADHVDVAVVAPDSFRPTGVVQVVPHAAVEVVSSTG